MDDRPDDLLEQAARAAWRHRLALAWSDSLTGPGTKACSREGSAAWKRAAPLSEEEGAAVGFFVERARKRNPAVVAGASGLVIVEADLDVADDVYPPLDEVEARVAALFTRLELRFPRSVVVRSRRGLHFYLRPEAECPPAKIQLAEEGDTVMFATDGYVVGVPGLHELPGVVYEYVRDGEIATLPASTYQRLVELGGNTHAETRRRLAEGESISKGDRDVGIFWFAVDLLRDGLTQAAALERALKAGRTQCVPPLAEKLVRKQFRGAVKWAATHPTETERARANARQILDDRRSRAEDATDGVDDVGQKAKRQRKTRTLFLPFSDVALTGPIRWAWRGKIPESAVTLLAGRPKLGKSLLAIWLASQLSLMTSESASRLRDVILGSAAEHYIEGHHESVSSRSEVEALFEKMELAERAVRDGVAIEASDEDTQYFVEAFRAGLSATP